MNRLTYLDLTRNGYFWLSDIGLVSTRPWRGRPVPRVLKPRTHRGGYLIYYVTIDGKVRGMLQHRIVYEAVWGAIPEGLQINHINSIRDDNRPENLEAVTQAENLRHGREFGNGDQSGEKNGRSKLTEADVREIHDLAKQGLSQRKIAGRFGVSDPLVCEILSGKKWRHIFKELYPNG